MKFPFYFLIFLLPLASAGQTSVYHPFPDSNAMWNIFGQGYAGNMCSIVDVVRTDYFFSYFISGDTTINNLSYHKIYSSGYTHEYCALDTTVNNWSSWDSLYEFSFRQDILSKKVFIYIWQENLLYNFNLNIEDTLHDTQNCATVVSIDSVFIGSTYRKRFNLSSPHQYSLIEGIGATCGLKQPLCPFEYTATLTCFMQDGITLYPDGDYACERITDVNDISSVRVNATFFPNPFHITTSLELNNVSEESELLIYNALGDKVRQQKITSPTSTINRYGLTNGIYFYRITDSKGKFTSGRLMIE